MAKKGGQMVLVWPTLTKKPNVETIEEEPVPGHPLERPQTPVNGAPRTPHI